MARVGRRGGRGSALFTVIQISRQTPHTTVLTYLILRWAHSVTWLLLVLSFLIRALAPDY